MSVKLMTALVLINCKTHPEETFYYSSQFQEMLEYGQVLPNLFYFFVSHHV